VRASGTVKGQSYIFAGGGSGGHLYPGLAVAEALRELAPGANVLFLATSRDIDRRILGETAWQHVAQPVAPLGRSFSSVFAAWRRWRQSVRRCRSLMQQHRPAAVLGLGGVGSAPALKVAAQLAVPAAMLNPDVVPGRANRFCRRYASRIFLQWGATRDYFGKDGKKCVVTGCPVRRAIADQTNLDKEARKIRQREACRHWELDVEKRTLVVMAGSQGGHNVNAAVVSLVRSGLNGQAHGIAWLEGWQIVHITGRQERQRLADQYAGAAVKVKVLAFTHRMDLLLGAADLVVSRAGASTVAELLAAGAPSILVPYPHHKDQHQLRNAEMLARAEAAKIVIDQADTAKTSKELWATLQQCMSDQAQLEGMGQAARSLAQPLAARTVAEQLLELAADSQ